MPLTTKQIAEYVELINNALDNIPVENKRDFIPIWEGLQDIVQFNENRTTKNEAIQEHLSGITDILNEPALGYAPPEIFPEFQDIIRQRIAAKIQELQEMTRSQQARYMRKQKQKTAKTKLAKFKLGKIANDSKWIQKQQMHNTGAPETYEEMLARREREFQGIATLPIFEINRMQPLREIRTRHGEIVVTSRELNELPIAIRAQFLENAPAVITLMTQTHISFNQLATMNPAVRAEFFQNATTLQDLCTYGRIPPEQLITMDAAIRTELIIHSHSFIGLNITRNFSVAQLTTLNAEQAHILLSDPNSLESRSILFNIEQSSRRGFGFCSIS